MTKVRDKFTKNGFQISDKWIESPDKGFLSISELSHFAFDGLKRIWSQEEKPDGLLIYPEDLINGALLAIMDEQIKVPEELSLVMHHNQENNILCPVPGYFLESSIKKMAHGLIKIVVDQFNGNEIAPAKQSYILKEHQ